MMKSSAIAYSFKKLSSRAYSIKDLRDTLSKAGYDRLETEEAIEYLLSNGYLNDYALACNLYEYYTVHKQCGPFLLRQKLREKGLFDDMIDSVMQNYTAEKEHEVLNITANRLLQKNKTENPKLLIRQLQRKGFSYEAILKYFYSKWPEKQAHTSYYPD